MRALEPAVDSGRFATTATLSSTPTLDEVGRFLAPFRADFGRRDRLRWAAVYLHGLLTADERKSVGTLARHAEGTAGFAVEDVTQALQNFINQSPWNERLIWRRWRQLVTPQLAPDAVLVLETFAIPKQGNHSVGVQRQSAGARGGKVNCQIAVGVSAVDAGGIRPLALRLYLPRGWVQDCTRLDAAGVPEEVRRPQSRGSVALDLLEELRVDGVQPRFVVAGSEFASPELRGGLSERGWVYLLATPPEETPLRDEIRWRLPDGSTFVSNAPEECLDELHARLWRRCERSRREQAERFARLGLGHFEGRSWRGFHHHACLVALASAFLAEW